MLSGKELFKYSKYLDKSVPQKGGAKDFHPDDSWLQAKRLESFYQERTSVLREQRIERRCSLVTGEWNPVKQLVELHKEMGKFWTHMGFVDQSRKWLYPEEALFLMETNVMEVWYKGLPISIQQAYGSFLHGGLTLEEYIVYAHLRRLGYVLLRHQGKLDITPYEIKIRLDQHIDGKKRKQTMKNKDDSESEDIKKTQQSKRIKISETWNEDHILSEEIDKTSNNMELNDLEITSEAEEITKQFSDATDKDKEECAMDTTNLDLLNKIGDSSNKDVCNDIGLDYGSSRNHGSSGNQSDLNIKEVMDQSLKCVRLEKSDIDAVQKVKHSNWDFCSISFPDIGCDKYVNLKMPNKEVLPPGIEIRSNNLTFDAEKYRKSSNLRYLKKQSKFVRETFIENLDFSYAEMLPDKTKIKANNWTEYKQKKAMKEVNEEDKYISPVEHLWNNDEIVPLVKPQDATDTANILQKLQVIHSVNLTKDTARKTGTVDVPKISFDVYLPDAKFKKSQPGLPNHRVCVTRRIDPPPDLQQIVYIQSLYQDDVPVHWAVVDAGDIAFYTFSDITLPVDITMG